MEIRIKSRQTKRLGKAFDLDFRWKGRRYRPLLGYNLDTKEAEARAVQMIVKIQKSDVPHVETRSASVTLYEFLPLYWQALEIKKRVDFRRPQPTASLWQAAFGYPRTRRWPDVYHGTS